MTEFLRKIDYPILLHAVKIRPQILGKVSDRLLRCLRILLAQIIDRIEHIVEEVRPHLAHHEHDPLIRHFLLAFIGLPDFPHVNEIRCDEQRETQRRGHELNRNADLSTDPDGENRSSDKGDHGCRT